MVIDGFKSYAQRTEISGFDCMFNAITGLNGSGKSNILDAICFLLGITNLSQVGVRNTLKMHLCSKRCIISTDRVFPLFDDICLLLELGKSHKFTRARLQKWSGWRHESNSQCCL